MLCYASFTRRKMVKRLAQPAFKDAMILLSNKNFSFNKEL